MLFSTNYGRFGIIIKFLSHPISQYMWFIGYYKYWGSPWPTKSIHISSCKFSVYFTRKNLLFLFYTITFTKHSHQFFYFTRYFNKIFTIHNFFIISLNHLSLYALSLSLSTHFSALLLSLYTNLSRHCSTRSPLLLPLPNHKTHPPSSSTTITESQPPPNLNHTLTP